MISPLTSRQMLLAAAAVVIVTEVGMLICKIERYDLPSMEFNVILA